MYIGTGGLWYPTCTGTGDGCGLGTEAELVAVLEVGRVSTSLRESYSPNKS